MTIVDWFDIHNIEHMRAYDHLMKTGNWPPAFIPTDVIFSPNWNIVIIYKMAEEYVNLFLKGDS